MTLPKLLLFFVLPLAETNAQYNSPPPYDRDRPNQQYDQQQDRQGPPYNQQYDRQNNPPYNQPYDRPNNPPYYDQQYNRRNNPPYDQQYDRQGFPNVGQYDRNPPYDRQNQYNQYNQSQYDRQYNQSQQYGRPNQYGNQSQYGNQGPPYYDRDRQQYNTEQRYNQNQQYDRFNNRNQQYYPNQQSGGNRDQYNRDKDQYYTGNRNEQYGGQQYGSPLFDTNDNCCEEYCYSEDEQPHVLFATKTAYQIVYGKASHQHNVPDCTPVQFWSINRHGTRFPSGRTIARLRQLERVHSEIIRNYDDRQSYPNRGRFCPKDLELFRKWRWNETVNEREANGLTSQGIEDLRLMARRYASKFGELLNQPYSDSNFNFQYTDTDRTHDSYQAYIEGLFRNNAYQVHANVFNDDKLIRPTKSCNAWIREIDDNPETMREYVQFKQRQEYQQMVRDVFRRLGYRYVPNDSLIHDMYDMCRYEKAWNLQQPSPWCIVFNKEQLKLLEYGEDLKYYYKSGYGNELNKKVGCPPMKDLYEKFSRTVDGDTSGHKVTVFFTHSATLQTFLTAMGVARDNEPLRADNYYRQQNRQWRTSKIDPFGSNLAAVLYQCRSNERYRVMFFLNEVPVNYPDCAVGLCNWSTVKNKLEGAAENCNMDFCDQNAAAGVRHNYIIYLLSFVAILFRFSH